MRETSSRLEPYARKPGASPLQAREERVCRLLCSRKEDAMLPDTNVEPMLPVKDMKAAESFYEKTLGLKKVHGEIDTALTYKSGSTTLCVYRSEFAGTNKGTAALWEVDDVEGTAKELKGRGVAFEKYDLPGLTRQGDTYRAGEMRVAWFKDPAGNILSIQNRPTRSTRS